MEIERKFEELAGKGEGALMPHVYFGDPSEEFSFKLIDTLVSSGADLLEFGIPFSDPIADGPTFIAACERALAAGVTPERCLEALKELRRRGIEVPVLVTTYYNVVCSVGVQEFCAKVKHAGAQGLIVPDLPVEESGELLAAAKERGLHVIFQVAPTTGSLRLERIVSKASGFLYIINIEGVTGDELRTSTLELIERVRKWTELPLMAGFGISRPQHVISLIRGGANGVVVGSAIARIYSRNLEDPESTLPEVAGFIRELKRACIQAR
jgi:tryptophan synthase alpha chain